ncbi:MAG: hypothetical protein A2Y10_11330 [Planctomycetes bacterium GWF2_41_51]|nr:MAG: hypothetical protein A2Y10_11330 [Planctomycetes bacterium GWF2_41_51]HBG26888.1 hypothetical protein [Phycisphaerales bacterium]
MNTNINKIFGLVIAFLALSVNVFADIVIENDYAQFVFNSSNGGLKSLIDKSSGQQHINSSSQDASLWKIQFLNSNTVESRTQNLQSSSVQISKDRTVNLEMVWQVSQYNFNVKVTIQLPNNSGIASMMISIQDNPSMPDINNVEFPKINGFLESGQYDIALPQDNWGKLYKNNTLGFYGIYPDGWSMSMQFVCATKGTDSVYIGAHDRTSTLKSFRGVPGQYFILDTLQAGTTGKGFDGFPVKLGVYQGAWMEGCKIYRQFAITAPWTAEGRISQRTSMPQQFKHIGLWMRFGDTPCPPEIPTATRNALLYQAQTFFNVPLGVHWYFWHNNNFDEDLPNYFPAKTGYPEQFADMVSRGWIVMPYINSRVISHNNIEEYQNWLCIDKQGNPYDEVFDGKLTHTVCQYTDFWQNKINTISQTLISSEIGANAVYHDQLAGSHPMPCYNAAHGHALGGGSHWVDGYRKMLHKIRETAAQSGKEVIQCGEFTAEPYMDGLDVFLIWSMGLDEQNIPMMPAVYSGYTLYMGSNASFGWSDTAWRMYVGRNFLWGSQCGWMTPEQLFAIGSEKKCQFLRQVGLFRVQWRKFLTYGELMATLGSSQTVTESWTIDPVKPNIPTLPAVQGSIWKAEDGTTGIFLVNYTNSTQNINFSVDLNSYFKPETKTVIIYRVNSRSTQLVGIYPKEIHNFNENLPLNELRMLDIKPFNADINGDRSVDYSDLEIIAENWLQGL